MEVGAAVYTVTESTTLFATAAVAAVAGAAVVLAVWACTGRRAHRREPVRVPCEDVPPVACAPQRDSAFCTVLPWELQSVVLGHVLGATPLARVPAAAAALGATCRHWHALLRADNALLWHTALAAHRAALPAVVAGAATAAQPLRARLAAAWRLACTPATSCRALCVEPRAAGHRDIVCPMAVAYPGASETISSSTSSNNARTSRAKTTRATEIAPDPRAVHCVAVAGDVKALLYRAMGAARDALPLVRAGMYPGGALALRCGRRAQLFLSARLPIAARSTQAVVVVVPGSAAAAGAAAAAASVATSVAAVAAHSRALPVAVLVPGARAAPLVPAPADIAAHLAPVLACVDHACVARFDPQSLDGVPQTLEWLYRHLPTLQPSSSSSSSSSSSRDHEGTPRRWQWLSWHW